MRIDKYMKIAAAALTGGYAAGKTEDAQAEQKIISVVKRLNSLTTTKKFKNLRIEVNPTAAELQNLLSTSGEKTVRAITFNSPSGKKNVIAWDAVTAIHPDVIEALGLPKSGTERPIRHIFTNRGEINSFAKSAGIAGIAGTTVMVSDPKEADAMFIGKRAEDFFKYDRFINPFDKRATAEISDHAAKLRPGWENAKTVGEMVDHPELFRNYPKKAENVKVTWNPEVGMTQGAYDPVKQVINIDPQAKDKLSTLLHELQHHIDRVEGINYGASESWLAAAKAPTELIKKFAKNATPHVNSLIHGAEYDIDMANKISGFIRGMPKDQKNVLNKVLNEYDKIKAAGYENADLPQSIVQKAMQIESKLSEVFDVDPGVLDGFLGKTADDTLNKLQRIQRLRLGELTQHREFLDAAAKNDMKGMRDWLAVKAKKSLYWHDASEVKARSVQSRRDLTPEQRKMYPVEKNMPIPEDELIRTDIPMSPRQEAREGSLLTHQPYLAPRNVEVKTNLGKAKREMISQFEGGGLERQSPEIEIALSLSPLGGPTKLQKIGSMAAAVAMEMLPDGSDLKPGMEPRMGALLGGLDWTSGDEKYQEIP